MKKLINLKSAAWFPFVIVLIVIGMPFSMFAKTPGASNFMQIDTVKFKTGYLDVNGIRLFYQDVGEGEPILFLHGGLGVSDDHFQPQFEAFSKHNRLITLDTRGHGKSEFDDRKFTYELFAKDTYHFLETLGIDSVNIIGYSDGGITGLLLAGQYPGKVKNLVIIGTNTVPDTTAFYPEDIEWVRNWNIEEMVNQVRKSFPEYPAPEKLTEFVERMQKLWLEEPNLTDSDLNKINCPVLIIAGDNDSIKMEHQVYIHRNIPNSDLLILPDTGHDAHIQRKNIVNQLIFEMIGNEN